MRSRIDHGILPPPVPCGFPSEPKHTWAGRRFLPERHGQTCRLVRAYRGKFLVEFANGFRVVTVRGTVRKLPMTSHTPEQKTLPFTK